MSNWVKCFGLCFHTNHFWLPQIKEIKVKYLRTLNIIKYEYVAQPVMACNREILLPLYHSLVRSTLNYGTPSMDSPHPRSLPFSNLFKMPAICICSRALCTSPSSSLSLCADSGYPLLHYHHLAHTANLHSSILFIPSTPIHHALLNTNLHSTPLPFRIPTHRRAHLQ